MAHCDGIDGPVVTKATRSLEQGNAPTGFHVVVIGEIRLVAHSARGSRLTAIVVPGAACLAAAARDSAGSRRIQAADRAGRRRS